jgi:hypothetical protein
LGYRGFDLLGDPIPEGRGEPGRTGHIPTSQNAKKIRLLLVADWTLDQIAGEIGISVPTLRKHYFANGKVNRKLAKSIAVREVKGRTLLQLDKAAEEGKVAAIKTILAIAEKESLTELPKAMQPERKPKVEPKGKKERLRDEAAEPPKEWGTLLDQVERPN